MEPLPAGKLPAELLASILAGLPAPSPEVVVGPQIGEDAAVLDVGGRYLVVASDPVTLSAEPGAFAVHVNANDIAVMGAEPHWLLASILLPTGATESTARSVADSLSRSAAQVGVVVIGGHTEITPSVSAPVVAATMIGEVAPDRLVRSSGARAGDRLLLAGPIAIEGTAILAADFSAELEGRGVSRGDLERAAGLLHEPGISVLPAARALCAAVLPHAMHDPTEGGLLSAVRELAAASELGVRLEEAHIPVLDVCRTICDALRLDPLRLLASGSLLAAVDPADVASARGALQLAGIEAAIVGEILPQEEGLLLHRDGRDEVLPVVPRDDLARWIESRG